MISILMPIYNGIEFLQESYESIKNQTFSGWELLIDINGHEKNSSTYITALEFAKIDSRVKVFDFFEERSKSKTLNRLVKVSLNNIICLFDVDDIWHPKKLEFQIPYIKYFNVVGTNAEYFGSKRGKPGIPTGIVDKNIFTIINPIINSSCMAWKDNCFWNESLNALEDYELWLRLNKENKSFFNLEEVLCYHRIHNTSFFNSKNNDKLENALKEKYRF